MLLPLLAHADRSFVHSCLMHSLPMRFESKVHACWGVHRQRNRTDAQRAGVACLVGLGTGVDRCCLIRLRDLSLLPGSCLGCRRLRDGLHGNKSVASANAHAWSRNPALLMITELKDMQSCCAHLLLLSSCGSTRCGWCSRRHGGRCRGLRSDRLGLVRHAQLAHCARARGPRGPRRQLCPWPCTHISCPPSHFGKVRTGPGWTTA